ncbi:hypothetical protein [Microcoleus sp. B4-D4]|uniref:hypothetical protein n=1 Tax=Microcoleus sp. B4-D4 TaxID=2818667 RepID=UPI002FD0D033
MVIAREEGRRKKEEGRRKFGNEQCTGCNGCKSVGRGKREEGRKENGAIAQTD